MFPPRPHKPHTPRKKTSSGRWTPSRHGRQAPPDANIRSFPNPASNFYVHGAHVAVSFPTSGYVSWLLHQKGSCGGGINSPGGSPFVQGQSRSNTKSYILLRDFKSQSLILLYRRLMALIEMLRWRSGFFFLWRIWWLTGSFPATLSALEKDRGDLVAMCSVSATQWCGGDDTLDTLPMSVYLAASLGSTCRRSDSSFLILSFGFEKKKSKKKRFWVQGRKLLEVTLFGIFASARLLLCLLILINIISFYFMFG
jgi:hypothetical protein